MNMQQPLSFCISLLFVIEAVCISQKTTKCSFGALLEVSDQFTSKLNVFNLEVLVENFTTILYDFE